VRSRRRGGARVCWLAQGRSVRPCGYIGDLGTTRPKRAKEKKSGSSSRAPHGARKQGELRRACRSRSRGGRLARRARERLCQGRRPVSYAGGTDRAGGLMRNASAVAVKVAVPAHGFRTARRPVRRTARLGRLRFRLSRRRPSRRDSSIARRRPRRSCVGRHIQHGFGVIRFPACRVEWMCDGMFLFRLVPRPCRRDILTSSVMVTLC
jgi:hypothetical protein